MGEDPGREHVEVVGAHVVAVLRERAGLQRRNRQHERAGRDALQNAGVVASRLGDIDEGLPHGRRDVDLVLDDLASVENLGARNPRQHVARTGANLLEVFEDRELSGAVDVYHPDLEEEAVELRAGQRERSGQIERVLRGDDEEEVVELARLVVDRRLLLGHRLEQRGLHLGRGPVDLVGEHDVREDRSGSEEEAVRIRVEDARSRDVRRQQVWRELDTADRDDLIVRHIIDDAITERLGEGRLSGSRIILEEHVTVGEDRGDDQLDYVVASEDRPAQSIPDAVNDPVRALEVFDRRRQRVRDVFALVELEVSVHCGNRHRDCRKENGLSIPAIRRDRFVDEES